MTWPCPAGTPGTDLWLTSWLRCQWAWGQWAKCAPCCCTCVPVGAGFFPQSMDEAEWKTAESRAWYMYKIDQLSKHLSRSNLKHYWESKAGSGPTHKHARSGLQREIWVLQVGGNNSHFSQGGLQILAMLGVARWNLYLAFCPQGRKQRRESKLRTKLLNFRRLAKEIWGSQGQNALHIDNLQMSSLFD